MMRFGKISVLLVVLCNIPWTVRAQSELSTRSDAPQSPAYAAESWPGGTSERGTYGLNRLETAAPLPEGGWVVNLGATYFVADDFFGDGGENERIRQLLNVTWSPIEWLDLSVSQSTVSNRNDAAPVRTTQSLGDPRFSLKVSDLLTPEIGVGGAVSVLLPTSAGGTGLTPEAFILDGSLLGSYFIAPHVQGTLNVGYRLDNSSDIFRRPEDALTPAQRFTASVSKVDLFTYGAGAEAQVELSERASLNPFVEITGAVPLSAAGSTKAPLLASLGAKFMPFGKGATEILLGGDFRISGAPDPEANELPGLPPWEVFTRVAFHLNTPQPVVVKSAPTSREPMTCELNSECPAGLLCQEGSCVKVVTKTEVVEKPVETFRISGRVVAQGTGDPIASATVKVSGYDESLLAVNYKDGTYTSMPIAVGEGLVQVVVEAPGYRTASQQIQRGKPDERVSLPFELQSLGEDAVGQVKGSLKDARTGKEIRGQVFFPALNRKVRVDRSGAFAARVKAGRYQVLITSKGFVTQKKELEIRAGDTVILNVDMSRGR